MPNKASPHGGPFLPGTISHGTLRQQDLLRAFADEYARLVPFNSSRLVADARECLEECDGDPGEWESKLLDSLFNELNYIASLHDHHFSAHPADASDFGFWPNEDPDAHN